MNPLAASIPVYAGGDVGAALPLNAPPAPFPLGVDRLLGIVMRVLQQLFLLLHYRVPDGLSDQFVGVSGR